MTNFTKDWISSYMKHNSDFFIFIQSVSEMIGQTSRVSSSHQNKEKISYKPRSRNEWILFQLKN